MTDRDAPRKKVVSFELPAVWTDGAPQVTFKDFIPEDPREGILTQFAPVNMRTYVAKYSRNVSSAYPLYDSTR